MGTRSASARLDDVEESIGSIKESQKSIQKTVDEIIQEIAKIRKNLDLLPDRRGKNMVIQGDDKTDVKKLVQNPDLI